MGKIRMTYRFIAIAACMFVGVSSAFAGGNRKADLQLIMSGEASTETSQINAYNVQVSNIGNRRARNVEVNVTLPVNGQYIQSNSSCTLSGQQLSCGLGKINAGGTRVIVFDFLAPAATETQYFTAVASTRSNESSLSNNQDTVVTQVNNPVPPPPPPPVAVTITPPEAFFMQTCTGSIPLTWQDCTPYSLVEATIVLDLNGNVTVPNTANYIGTWSQSTDLKHLDVVVNNSYTSTTSTLMGSGVSADCFQGTTVHSDNNNQYPDNYSAWQWCRVVP